MFQLIASFPKSGNTYTRIFLAHYLRGEENLNHTGFPIFSSRANFPLYMPPRPAIRSFPEIRICKTHETSSGFSPACVASAIYLVRNPLDVVLSYSRHMSISVNHAIKQINNYNLHLRGTDHIYPQRVSSWSVNVNSWLNCKKFPVLVIRYEDLIIDPTKHFRRIIHFLGAPIDEERLRKSVEFTMFDNLKRREQEMLDEAEKLAADEREVKKVAYKEARGSTGKFFNVGKFGQWKTDLTTDQISTIISHHKRIMLQLGYAKETP